MRTGAALVLLAGLATSAADVPAASTQALAVEGTEFVLRQDGRVLRSADLVGAELDVNGQTLRIDAVERDPADRDVWLHSFSRRDTGGAWAPACTADATGRQAGFPLAARWDANGRFHPDPTRLSLSCTSGAEAKCVRFGYKFWQHARDGAALAPLYEACVHMVRADYCGDGVPGTRNGTPIDVYDRHGVQQPTDDPAFRFEAGWAPTGAVCVAHTRIPDEVTLQALGKRCPRLAAQLGTGCTEAEASKMGAVVYNGSR